MIVCGLSKAIVSKSSRENLRTDGIMIDSTIVDQKPGRRNVRFNVCDDILVNV